MRPERELPRARLLARDDGSAAVEFIAVGVILLVPFVYLVIVLGAVQSQMLGAEAAARHTVRLITSAPDAATAAVRADQALAVAVREYDMAPDAVELRMHCTPAAATCPSAGAMVVVTVRTTVSLPFVPAVFGLDRVTAVPIEATAVGRVSRGWRDG